MFANKMCGTLVLAMALTTVGATQAHAQDRKLSVGIWESWSAGTAETGFTIGIISGATTDHKVATPTSNALASSALFSDVRLFGRKEVLVDVNVTASAKRSGTTLATAETCARGVFRLLGLDIVPSRGGCWADGRNAGYGDGGHVGGISGGSFFSARTSYDYGVGTVTAALTAFGTLEGSYSADADNGSRYEGGAATRFKVEADLSTIGSASASVAGLKGIITSRMQIVNASFQPSYSAQRLFDNSGVSKWNTYYAVNSNTPITIRGLDGITTLEIKLFGVHLDTLTLWNPRALVNISKNYGDFNEAILTSSFR